MNKQIKKKLELQLQTAMEGILLKQDLKATEKSRKSIKQASKAVVKKFNKAVKASEKEATDEKKKKLKIKKKIQGKSPLKNFDGETAKVTRTYSKETPIPPADTTPAVRSAEGTSGTENM